MATREVQDNIGKNDIKYEIPGLTDKISEYTRERIGVPLVTIDDRELIGIDKKEMKFYVDIPFLESIDEREGITPELMYRIRSFDNRLFDDRMRVKDINDEIDAIVQGLLNGGVIAKNELSSYNAEDIIFLIQSDIEPIDEISVDYSRQKIPKDGPRDAYEHKKEMEKIKEDMYRIELHRQQMQNDVNKYKSEVDAIYQRIRRLQADVKKKTLTRTRGEEAPDIEELEKRAEHLDALSKKLEEILKTKPY